MKKKKIYGLALIYVFLICLPCSQAWTDGGYFSNRSVAVSADQRAIIIKNGSKISMTFSTGYTGKGGDFGWIIPTPVPPAVEDVSEAGESGETAFQILDEYTAPKIYKSGGCFPSGTEVLTAGGTRAIETVEPGTKVYAHDLATGEWILKRVLKRLSHQYEGDMIAVQMGHITIRATGNHPFYVVRGDRLASRPLPQDVPKEEQGMTEYGRWVEACDLKEGDVLHGKNVEGLIITGLSSRHEKAEVYNLTVEDCHNYAVHRKGILVHNKRGPEQPSSSILVTIYGRVLLEHYAVSILGADDATHIMNWLQENGYQVNLSVRDVLDTYVKQNWAFVAVKLNPSEKRHYENEFLPPLTIRYRHGQLIFPLHISSVSTTRTVRITLYVIAESTVTSSNLPTTTLRFKEQLFEPVYPNSYVESCIQETMGGKYGGGLSVMWSGEFAPSVEQQNIIDGLMKTPFSKSQKSYLTRLETRMGPADMTEDIRFILDPHPKKFRVRIQAREGYFSALIVAARDGETDTVQKLLQEGTDVNAANDDGMTALTWAARGGHREVVQILLDAGADVNIVDEYGMTALMWAEKGSHSEVVKILLKAGADVDVGVYHLPALTKAARRGYNEVVQILLQAGADVNMRGENGNTALTGAAWGGHAEVVQILLEVGADVNGRYENDKTALMSAARGGHTEVLQILLRAGAAVNLKDEYDNTALMETADEGHTEIVQILLEAGADVNPRVEYGNTALTLAARGGHTEVVQILLRAGADLHAKYDGALMLAASGGHTEVVQILLDAGADVNAQYQNKDGWIALMRAARGGHTEVVQILLEAGADVNAKDEDGWTALIIAADGYTKVVKLLLKAGADVNARTGNGWIALMRAARGGHTEVVQILLRAGADVSPSDGNGLTALINAAQGGYTKVVKLLLEAGADVNARTGSGWTALMWAARGGYTKVVQLLLEAGADVHTKDNSGL